MATHVFQNLYVPETVTIQDMKFSATNTIESLSSSLNLVAGGTGDVNLTSGGLTGSINLTSANAINLLGGQTGSINLTAGGVTGDVSLTSVNAIRLTAPHVVLSTDPTNALDAATKQYVDNAIYKIDWKESVRVTSIGPVSAGSYTYMHTYTTTASVDIDFTSTTGLFYGIDVSTTSPLFDMGSPAVTMAIGNRILVKNQTPGNEYQNGIYYIHAIPDPDLPNPLTSVILFRAPDSDGLPNVGEVSAGNAVFVEVGVNEAGKGYLLSGDGTILVDSGAQNWIQFSASGTSHHSLSGWDAFDDHQQYARIDGRLGGQTISGGTGAGESLSLRGNSVDLAGTVAITSTTESPIGDTGAGALTVAGGVGIAGNLNVANFAFVGATAESNTPTQGALQVLGGAGIVKNLNVGGKVGVFDITTSTSSSTGALLVAGGVGVSGSVYVKNKIVTEDTTASTSPLTGALLVAGGAGVSGALFIGGDVVTESTTVSSSPATGALRVAGGVGVTGDVNVGGAVNIYGLTGSTSPSTGVLLVNGGVGITGDVNVSGYVQAGSLKVATNSITSTGDNDINILPGGTGHVLLNADPISPLGAVTKQYVDNKKSSFVYQLASQQVIATSPSFSTVAYFPWVGSEYSGYTGAELIFEAGPTGGYALEYRVVDASAGATGVYWDSGATGATGIFTPGFSALPPNGGHPLPGAANARLAFQIRKTGSGSPDPSVFGSAFKFQNQLA